MPVSPVRVFEKLPANTIGGSITFTPFGGSVAFTPSGLVLFAKKNQIVEASVVTGKTGRAFTAEKSVIACFALARAAPRLAALADDGTVFLWNAATGRRLHVFKLRDGNEYSRADYDVAISPDGRYLAVCGSGVVRVFDLVTGRILKAFHYLFAAVFAPDSKTLFLGGARRLQAWDVITWRSRRLQQLGDFMTTPTFTAMDCSPDGKRIAGGVTSSRPGQSILAVNEATTFEEVWEAETGSMDFTSEASKVIYSPSGNRIAAGIRANNRGEDVPAGVSLFLTNAENGKPAGYYEVKKTIRSLAFSPNGKYLAALTDRVTVWPVIP